MGHHASHVCPWWFIRTFDNPLRRLLQHPERILREFVRAGDACLDLGCGIGYFTIPIARLVGPTGSVTAVDLQPRMLEGARRRARRAGVLPRIRFVEADASSDDLDGVFDFALAFWMLHEVPDPGATLQVVADRLKPGKPLLLVEPKGHVSRAAFADSVRTAEARGFAAIGTRAIAFSHAMLLARSG